MFIKDVTLPDYKTEYNKYLFQVFQACEWGHKVVEVEETKSKKEIQKKSSK